MKFMDCFIRLFNASVWDTPRDRLAVLSSHGHLTLLGFQGLTLRFYNLPSIMTTLGPWDNEACDYDFQGITSVSR